MVFHLEADVLVVGSGAAAFAAAVTAKNHGADVIMLEKSGLVGGTTLRSGGGYWIPNNRFQQALGITDLKEDALRYMARYSYPHLYNPEAARLGLPENEYALIETYYDSASEMVEYLEQIGAVQSIQEINWTGKPQVDYMDHLPENRGVRGRVLYSRNPEGKMSYGGELIRQFKSWAQAHSIKILTNHQVVQILQNPQKEVIGLRVRANGTEMLDFLARKAVVFGSGGYTHNPELMLHFQRGPHFGGCAVPTNTGDFIQMAGETGAKLGNTAGAFRAEIVLEQALSDPQGVHNVFYIPGDSVLEVNRYGLRFMDEKRNYNDRAMTHFLWDPQRAEWTQMLVFMMFDERTATLWQGFPPYPVQGTPAEHILSADTWDGLSEAIAQRLKALSPHTGGFSLDADFRENLKRTVARFNAFARTGIDQDFHRGEYAYDREWTTFPPTIPGIQWPPADTSNHTMYPLKENGPYYAVILGAGTLDTNGGPMINAHAQVVDGRHLPIPGLYGAGNCIASPTANAYWGAGSTIGPAMTFGYIAGLNAVLEAEKAAR